MNTFTIKQAIYLFLVLLCSGQLVFAQDINPDVPKTFGGRGQYNTWTVGLNLGATSPRSAIGGSNDFGRNMVGLGYGLSVKKQLAYSFALQLDLTRGYVAGGSTSGRPYVTNSAGQNFVSYRTDYWQGSINGVVNVANVNYMHRENAINFYLNAGFGLADYLPTLVQLCHSLQFKYQNRVLSMVIPVGGGVRFKVNDAIALNAGYTLNFMDGDNFDGVNYRYPTKDHYSYGYGGFEFTFGPKSKRNLAWVNPVAIMYDELHDETLRKEVEALKGRTTNVENAVNDLKKDADGDGVADQFDKCPNTPAGTVVDGSGCPVAFPKVN